MQAVDVEEPRSTLLNETRPPAAGPQRSFLLRIRACLALRVGRKLGAAQASNVYPLF